MKLIHKAVALTGILIMLVPAVFIGAAIFFSQKQKTETNLN